MTERELLVDCLRRLNRAGVRYMLTGSMASNYWGIPRTTHDLDFVVALLPEEVPRLAREFRDEFSLDEQAVLEALQPPHQFNAIDTRSALKVDFWPLRPSRPFDVEMFGRRVQQTLFGEPAWIATAEDVVLHKLYWNQLAPSERQLGDAAGVIALQPTLDLAHLRHWAAQLGVGAVLEDLLAGKIRPKQT
jgi:hypothetical protein